MTSIEIALEAVEHQFENVSESPTDIPVARKVLFGVKLLCRSNIPTRELIYTIKNQSFSTLAMPR